ncbi:competence protein ComEA [Kineococcus radiotolerans]|uniref:Competence protein ComEA n=1 Tax=Kineococcus radiotolerans TaxID=131568 RepID=A0A7W4XXQ7_KINRA|nr:ComEA family DNA-binding protein [Kineococcus radiotolerans]MBB2901742.1 competence protein ComEA [Kineococcus radiotolerans]
MPSSYHPREPAHRARALASRQYRRVDPAARESAPDPGGESGGEFDGEFDEGLDGEFDGGSGGESDEGPGTPVPRTGPVAELTRRLADRTPPGIRAARVRVGPRAAAGALLVAVLVAAGLGFAAWRTWPPAPAAAGEALPGRAEPPAPTAPAASSAPSGEPPVVVHVTGRVTAPGLVTLPAGSRVGDALTAAGGALPGADLDAVNLARVLVDGEQVLVPVPGQHPVAVPAAPGAGSRGGPLDLNAATPEELDGLPGVGEVLAGRIVAWREENGPFRDVEDLGDVPGIGPKVLDGLRDLVTA